MYTFEEVDLIPWAAELIHTKAVRGMRRTAERRPLYKLANGRETRSQRWWMLMRPTLDPLWFRCGPAHYRLELAILKAVRAIKAEGGEA